MPITSSQRDAYAAEMEAVIARALDLREQGSAEVSQLVVDLLSEIADLIDTWPDKPWRQGFSRELEQAIRAVVDDWEVVYFEHALAGLDESFRLASMGSVIPLAELGIITAETLASLPGVDAVLLNVAGEFTADLIQRLGKDVQDEIAGFVRRSILTGRTQRETQLDILATLEREGADVFRFGTLRRRAEVIYDTEVGRLFGMTDEVRSRQLNEMWPGTRKWWDASGDERTRPEHLALEAQTKEAPIPMDEPFVIHTRYGTVRLDFPVDSGAKGPERAVKSQTIGCRCRRRTKLPVTNAPPRPVSGGAAAAVEDMVLERFDAFEGRMAA